MHKEFLMGNAAIALGAVASGVNVVAGYPGTPSTEVLETIAKHRPDDVYVEWSVNEKAAMELAAGAAYAGARSLVTMKQVGLNVASDPLMSLEYVGIKGGMVVLVADDRDRSLHRRNRIQDILPHFQSFLALILLPRRKPMR